MCCIQFTFRRKGASYKCMLFEIWSISPSENYSKSSSFEFFIGGLFVDVHLDLLDCYFEPLYAFCLVVAVSVSSLRLHEILIFRRISKYCGKHFRIFRILERHPLESSAFFKLLLGWVFRGWLGNSVRWSRGTEIWTMSNCEWNEIQKSSF